MYRLGIDVGGTNTDCAILDENLNCIGKIKSPTMENVSLGIDAAIQKILAETRIPTDKISVVMLGTTHCTNAIVQRKEMSKVGNHSFSQTSHHCGCSHGWLAGGSCRKNERADSYCLRRL
jgi:N-acetylglucosamine kinase-like BadF-type ATPase